MYDKISSCFGYWARIASHWWTCLCNSPATKTSGFRNERKLGDALALSVETIWTEGTGVTTPSGSPFQSNQLMATRWFCKGYSPCLVIIFVHFPNSLIFRLLAGFLAVFCIEQLQCLLKTFLAIFFAFLIFDPKWRFCQVYSPFLVAIFGNFQYGLIFRILAVFLSGFSHRTTIEFS